MLFIELTPSDDARTFWLNIEKIVSMTEKNGVTMLWEGGYAPEKPFVVKESIVEILQMIPTGCEK